jgi:tetratricopeptide (TPR) repeat protein
MGLLDEAIGEFQMVCQAIDQGQPFPQVLQAYTWLAHCLVTKGAPEASFKWYQRALQAAPDDAARIAIQYELAEAYEAAGRKQEALSQYMEVYGSNIDYREVAQRIKALKS